MLVKRSWCESRKLFKMPRLCHGTFPTFFRTAHRVSSNLARSLDCSQDGSSGEVRPTGVGSCRVREEEAGVGGGGPPFSGTGAPRLPPASNGGVLPATCARGVCSQGGGRRRRWISHGSTLVGFPPLCWPQADAWKLTRTPGLCEAPGSQGDSHCGAGLRRRCRLRRAWRRGRFDPARREGGDRGQRPAPGGALRPPPFNWPRRPLSRDAGGGGPPLVGLVGQSLEVRGRRWGAVRAGLRSRAGASGGPRPTE